MSRYGKQKIIRFLVPSLIFDDQNDFRFTLCVDLINAFEYFTPAKIIINNWKLEEKLETTHFGYQSLPIFAQKLNNERAARDFVRIGKIQQAGL